MTKTISINQFRVKIYDTRAEMGFCAADEAAAAIRAAGFTALTVLTVNGFEQQEL